MFAYFSIKAVLKRQLSELKFSKLIFKPTYGQNIIATKCDQNNKKNVKMHEANFSSKFHGHMFIF